MLKHTETIRRQIDLSINYHSGYTGSKFYLTG